MLKRIITSFISLIALGATVAIAEAPSAEGTPSSTTNIRNTREALPPITVPSTALQGKWWGLARQVGWAEKDLLILDFVFTERAEGIIKHGTDKTRSEEAVVWFRSTEVGQNGYAKKTSFNNPKTYSTQQSALRQG